MTRREVLGALLAASRLRAAGSAGPLVDTKVELFSNDLVRFPLARNAPARPAPMPVEQYAQIAKAAGVERAVIAANEAYQDDYRYMEYCFAHEPAKGFFKGTCWFDPEARDAADRLASEVGLNPGRVVALAVRARQGRWPDVKALWRRAVQLKLVIDLEAPPGLVGSVTEMPEATVVIDRVTDDPAVLRLAKMPRVWARYSNPKIPAKRIFEAFGPDRIVWGGFGASAAAWDEAFSFVKDDDRRKVRGENALELYGWKQGN
jgi:predicted TIM-barrel fold metal-dependent hydrolase